MARLLSLILCAWLLLPTVAAAEDPPSKEEVLATLRHSGSYQEGLERVREKIEYAYDAGAVNGAPHWETIHRYYIELALSKGCKKGSPYSEGPVKVCHKVSMPEPKLLGPPYEKGRQDIAAASLESLYPELVRQVLFVIYDYGYVQGLKHGLRRDNADLRWAQNYYRSCVERANDSKHEPLCADSSKAWSEGLLSKLRKQIEEHGLPAGKRPK